MYNDYIAQIDNQQRERELTQAVERRRIAAERAAMRFDGDRLALIAHLTRAARRTQPKPGHPVSC